MHRDRRIPGFSYDKEVKGHSRNILPQRGSKVIELSTQIRKRLQHGFYLLLTQDNDQSPSMLQAVNMMSVNGIGVTGVWCNCYYASQPTPFPI
jgi:hypothetical protein